MTQLFTASDYAKIHSIVFQSDYPGYRPDVVESPNGDGKKDDLKRYAHVAEKYLNQYLHQPCSPADRAWQTDNYHLLSSYLDKAHALSLEVAIAIGVPRPFWPVRKNGALRVLEYDGNAITNPHTDFDLFTLMLYRNDPSWFQYIKRTDRTVLVDAISAENLERAQKLNAQIHFGELLEEILPDDFVANKHEVVASGGPWQYSCVYFAIPEYSVVLPSGQRVGPSDEPGSWLYERMQRSRYDRG